MEYDYLWFISYENNREKQFSELESCECEKCVISVNHTSPLKWMVLEFYSEKSKQNLSAEKFRLPGTRAIHG